MSELEFHAVAKTIKGVFASDSRYVVPRFQREYSWTVDELTELWKDILISLKYGKEKLKAEEYFIGSLVLIGGNTSSHFEIIDGQQRLTSITVLFSALVETFREMGEEKLARGCYMYVEGNDSDFTEFFRLENKRSSDYIKRTIQNFNKEKLEATTSEQKKLKFAYDFFKKKLKEKTLIEDMNSFMELSEEVNTETHKKYLHAIREQILHLKTIYITVADKDEAYNIFETLNAKGLDLSIVDLIKNQIFKVLKDEHPTDYAKKQWENLVLNLNERENQTDLNVFFRHFWVSKYEQITESKIYKSFTRIIPREDKVEMKAFLDTLVDESKNYQLITSPHSEDWKEQQFKDIYRSLTALSIFRVISPRPLLLALLKSRQKGNISQEYLIKSLEAIEHFHFVFSTICSSSASGLESKYSKFAREVRGADNKQDCHKIINNLIQYLKDKMPDYDKFMTRFDTKLKYSTEYTREKKVIQYFFKKLEYHYRQKKELEISDLTIEHILPQSSKEIISSTIGNLLPLSQELNSKCKDKVLGDKKRFYDESDFRTVEKFLEDNPTKTEWTEEDITQRTAMLADLAYNQIFVIK
ncbi:TPA: DUF262 domain-containing protein [Bacillus cereus]